MERKGRRKNGGKKRSKNKDEVEGRDTLVQVAQKLLSQS
jgi:hypothetical protein